VNFPGQTRRAAALAIGVILVVGGVSCAEPESARAKWLRHTVVLDNQPFLEREPDLVAGKFALMGEDLYPFFRGTAAQYTRDAMTPGSPGYASTRYGSAESRDVALVGDPHPENIGAYRTGGGVVTIDFNDFDAATYGPYTLDLRRLVLGFWIAGTDAQRRTRPDGAGTITEADRIAMVEAMVAGYADEVRAIRDDLDTGTVITIEGTWGAVLDAILVEADAEGAGRERISDYTEIVDGQRHMITGEVDPARVATFGPYEALVFEDSVRDVGPRTRDVLATATLEYVATVHDPTVLGEDLRILGMTRRYGSGVSSYPQLRYYVLLDGATPDPDDDILLEAKETVDPPVMPGLQRLPEPPFASNGERVVFMQRELQGFIDDDPYLGWALAGNQTFRFRERTAYQQGFRVTDLVENLDAGEWTASDFVEFATWAARLLGRSHGAARKQDGNRGAAAIADAIGDDVPGLAAETLEFVRGYAEQVDEDQAAFATMLGQFGLDLGYVAR
jgi:uncharacterized protein (DUF2252 family)